jgi:hypothetical protein
MALHKLTKEEKEKFPSALDGFFEVPVSDFSGFRRVNIVIGRRRQQDVRGTDLENFWDNIRSMTKSFEEGSGGRGLGSRDPRVVSSIVLFFQPKDARQKNNIRNTTVSIDEFDRFRTFKKRIDDQQAGHVPGSDTYPEDEYILLMNIFTIMSVDKDEGFSNTFKSNIFNLVDVEKLEVNTCGFDILKHLKCKITIEQYNEWKLYQYEEFKDYLKKNKIDVGIIGDVINLYSAEEFNKKKTTELLINGRTVRLRKIELEDFEPFFLFGHDETEHYILYNKEKKHFALIDKKNILKENLFCSMKRDIYEKRESKNKKAGNKFFYHKIILFNKVIRDRRDYGVVKKPDHQMRYLFFDYETVVDYKEQNICRPYSLAWLDLSFEDLEMLNKADEDGDKFTIKKMCESRGHFSVSFDCSKSLYDYIRDKPNIIYKFVSFNGSNFDNFILYNDFQKINGDSVGSCFYANSSLLNFKIWGIHHMYDLRRHLIGSLAENCENFKVRSCSKTSFNHNDAQILYNENILMEKLDYGELKDYNIKDVLSLAVLFHKYTDELKKLPAPFESFDVAEKFTISSYAYSVINKHWQNKKINVKNFYVPIKTEADEQKRIRFMKYYNDLKTHNAGGRVELFNGAKVLLELFASLDACSLYPYVMAVINCFYPSGDIIETDKYIDGAIGFYYCDIDQSALKKRKHRKPLIMCDKSGKVNDWATNKKLENHLISTININYLKSWGCDVTVKNGFYFDPKNNKKSCEMFEPLLELMKIKNQQDKLCRDEDPRYNPSLRLVVKLLSNCVSGKMIEGLHLEEIKQINTYEWMKLKGVNNLTLLDVNNGTVLVSIKKTQEDVMKSTKPVYMGVLIYDASKIHMYEHMYSRIRYADLIYTDTDALKMSQKVFENWAKKYASKVVVPHWPEVEKWDPTFKTHTLYNPNSKVYGSFENEYDGMGGFDINYFLAKKQYLSANKKKSKMTFKGVSNNDVIVYTKKVRNKNIQYVKNELGDHLEITNCGSEWLANVYAIAQKIHTDKYCNRIELFETLDRDKQITILTQTFQRCIKTAKYSNHIKIFCRLKTIKL